MIIIFRYIIPWIIVGIISTILWQKRDKKIVTIPNLFFGIFGPIVTFFFILSIIIDLFDKLKLNKKPIFDFSANPEENEKERIRESIKELKKYFDKYPELLNDFVNNERNKKIFKILTKIKNKK